MPITINGSGTVTGISAGGLPDGVIATDDIAANAVTPAKLASTVVGPVFSAYRSGNQSITTSVATKVQLNAEDFDPDNCFDSTTNYRFTPSVAGYYQITVSLYITSSTNSTNAIIPSIFKNGLSYASGPYIYSSAGYVDGKSVASNLVYLNGSTDYIEMSAFVLGGGTLNINYAQLQGFLARPA